MHDDKYDRLYAKYKALVEENKSLKAKIELLEAESVRPESPANSPVDKNQKLFKQSSLFQDNPEQDRCNVNLTVTKYSTNKEKTALFMSLFKGRKDVYAKRWQNKKGLSGYSPVCLNEWEHGVCEKPIIKCSKCSHKLYSPVNEYVIENHLRGNIIAGVYPMCTDETCYFLAIDFDKDGWEKDISTITKTCSEFEIPIAVERSRSGNGGHVWFFFQEEIPASLARQFGTSLLTYSMNKRHKISFKSYDRLFPNQDTMPKGGFGNLIALPLQMASRKNRNSLFVDEDFKPFQDQWKFLSDIQKLRENELVSFISTLNTGNELGTLKIHDEESSGRPWVKKEIKLQPQDFPEIIEVVKSGMLYIKKDGLSQKALNILQRFAAFKNPEFYRNQAMRMPVYNTPRIISCSINFENFLALPRGCDDDINILAKNNKTKICWIDKTNQGRSINVKFKGKLRDEQHEACDALLKHDNGVLSATTAFGKTIVGAALIGSRKVNTLVLVHRQQLLTQWIDKLSDFLVIDEKLPDHSKTKGRKKRPGLIGHLAGGKDCLSSIVDVATMQSLNSGGKVKDCVNNYGMIIVDECHRIPAFSFEQILRKTQAKYVYGLTATPIRKDGHHPIIFYHCGPKRYTVDAKEQSEKRPFDHYMIPRFTSFKSSSVDLSFQEIYSELIEDELRNQLIIDDVIECYKKGRNSLVLTGRVAHVKSLTDKLKNGIPDLISITGGMGTKKTKELLKKITSLPANKPLVLISTGSFIGEGFDEPRLDTLFLVMPVAWKGTLQQYTGRLHRLFNTKKDVQIYDYVDIHIKMLEKMYGKRLKVYSTTGYKTKLDNIPESPSDIIFDKNSFFPVYLTDIDNALKQVVIVSPFVTLKRVLQMIEHFNPIVKRQVEITIFTRPVNDFKANKKIMLQKTFSILEDEGIQIIFKSNIHQKFAIIDNKTIWYGSINLLSFGYSEESIMRLRSSNIAYELTKSIGFNAL